MFPITHFIVSLILAILLYPIYGLWSLSTFIGGFLIDIDHYFYYVIEKRKLSLIKCYKDLTKESVKNKKLFEKIKKRPLHINWDRLHIFHVWEFFVLAVLLSFINKLFFISLLGMILHLSLDFLELSLDRVYGRRAISFFYWMKRHTKK